MSAHVSTIFEKTLLTTSAQVRVIIRNRDDGGVPPPPSAVYYPTTPDALRDFVVGQYVSDFTGELFTRIATLSDLTTYSVRTLDTIEDTTANFAAVMPNDTISITIPDPQYWTSDEYTETNPFTFTVLSVISATKLQLTRALPAFYNGFSWTIPAHSLTGYAGVTRRNGSPAPLSYFRVNRFNYVDDTVVAVDNAVALMKAQLQALVNDSTGANLIDELITVSSQV